MNHLKHKCIDCKNEFYCYDNMDGYVVGCMCYKHRKWFNSSLFNNKIHNEIIYCCSEQCNVNCINELNVYKYFNTIYDIDRTDELIFKVFNTAMELFKFFGIIIYFYCLIKIIKYIFSCSFICS
jgi:hypothetical protein